MTTPLQMSLWPLDQLGEAAYTIASHLNLNLPETPPPTPPATVQSTATIDQWLTTTVPAVQLEATAVYTPYGDLPTFLQTAAPALIQIPQETGIYFLVVLRTGRGKVKVITPQHTLLTLPLETVRTALTVPLEEPLRDEVDQLLTISKVPARRETAVRAAILRQRLVGKQVGGVWLLEMAPSSNFGRQLLRAGAGRQVLRFAGAYTSQHLLLLFSWWLIGQAIFNQGRVDLSLFTMWAMVIVTLMPLRLLAAWLQGVIMTTVSGLLQKRLLYGTMRLHPDEIRHQGVGQLMGRVFESELIGTISIRGVVEGVNGIIELILAFGVLALGVGGGWLTLLLAIWTGLVFFIAYNFYYNRQRWTATRRRLTNSLVERMVGHRTRAAQNRPSRWHDGEDQSLAHYADIMDGLTRSAAILSVLTGRIWLFLGFTGLAYFFIQGESDPAILAITVGGILSAELGLAKISVAFNGMVAMWVAWEEVGLLYKAAEREVVVGNPDTAVLPPAPTTNPDAILLDVNNLSYRYTTESPLILQDCDLRIYHGDRILLEGPSGGGKSTLAALLTGLRQPEHGLLLLQGLDHHTLGAAGWRRRVVAAPQFHENHVMESSFLFNLLMGRNWPPQAEDVAAAWAVCEALGLDEVIGQMPGGMLQPVGERGWQLSHGERSRLYIARALLQQADLIILDESFAALDPVNLERAMRCVLDQAPALLVIAHP